MGKFGNDIALRTQWLKLNLNIFRKGEGKKADWGAKRRSKQPGVY